MLDWKQERETVWTYKADDLCACVWVEYGGVWWDVSGPGGRGTITSGTTPPYLSDGKRVAVAKRLAEVYIAGYRAGRKA